MKQCKSRPWTLDELIAATKTLRNNKSRDPFGIISEVFKPEVAGTDLKLAVLNFLNMILDTFYIPQELKCSNITSIWKRKGSRMDLSNDRGIFILSVLRKILDKILYMHLYPDLDTSMSDSNIGARSKKNVRNHLFIINGIINSVVKEGRECIDIMIYDIVQAFDSLWLQDCMNELYDLLPSGKHDSKLALVYELNRENLVAVKTPVGLTERIDLPEIVQQGGSWGPIECSVSIDKIGRECKRRNEYIYYYKNKAEVLPLAMVNDLLAVAHCGIMSVALNTFIVTHIEMKKLRLHTPDKSGKSKCHKIHVGKKNMFCPKLLIHGTEMESVASDTYLGDIISADGSNKLNIESRVKRGLGKVAEIMSMIQTLTAGKHYFKVALLLRDSLFISSLLFNSEVWYRISKSELNKLETLDRQLLRRICSLPNSVPSAALYLETGAVRIGTLIKARRVMYLHYLVNLPKTEMLGKFFALQWRDSKEYDWCYQVKKDLFDFNLDLDISEIKKKSVFSWKFLVKRKVKEFELNQLLEISRNQTKLSLLSYDSLSTQNYLTQLDSKKAKVVLRYRTRMSRFSDNYKGKEGIVKCPLCKSHNDFQSLCFECPYVIKLVDKSVKYEDIFRENISEKLALVLEKIENLRENCLLEAPIVHQ